MNIPSPQLAIKSSSPDSPQDAAQAEEEAARADVRRLTKAMPEQNKKGGGVDPVWLEGLEVERKKALKNLRRVNREAPEQEEILRLTQYHVSSLERAIRVDPGQYFWFHRRWKTRRKERNGEE